MKKLIMLSFIFCFMIFSCKKDSKNNSTSKTPEIMKDALPPTTKSRTAYGKVDETFLNQSRSAKPYLMITDSLWLFYVAINPMEAEKPKPILFEKVWLDLKENGEFEYGKEDNLIDKGHFTYTSTNEELELRSAIKDSASNWTVKVDPDAMILIGSQKYGNNPWQIKLVRKSNYNQKLR